MKNDRPVRVAFPDPGKERKLSEPFQQALARTGFVVRPSPANANIMEVADARGEITPFELIYLRTKDAPVYMEKGAVDLAVLGRNILDEFNCAAKLEGRALKVAARTGLNFSACRLVMAVPAERRDEIRQPSDLLRLKQEETAKLRVATSYPATVTAWMLEQGIDQNAFEIVKLSGGVETSISMGLADIVCDITQTGSSLKKNDLAEIYQLAGDSTAVIAVRRGEGGTEEPDAGAADRIARRIEQACADLFSPGAGSPPETATVARSAPAPERVYGL